MKFTKTETGGSCTPGCHKVKDYDRDTPVDYAAPAAAKAPEPKPEPVKDQQEAINVQTPQQEAENAVVSGT